MLDLLARSCSRTRRRDSSLCVHAGAAQRVFYPLRLTLLDARHGRGMETAMLRL